MGLKLVMVLLLVKATAAGPLVLGGMLQPLFRLTGAAANINLHGSVFNPYRIAADLDAWAVGPGPIGQAKTPRVPRTGYDAVLDVTAAQRSTHVRTEHRRSQSTGRCGKKRQ